MKYLSWRRKKGEYPSEAIVHLEKPNPNDMSEQKLLLYLQHLEEFPEDMIGSLSISLHIFNQTILGEKDQQILVQFDQTNFVIPITGFQSLTSSKINRFVLLKGRITLMSSPRLLVLAALFTCQDCRQSTVRHFKDGIYSAPGSC